MKKEDSSFRQESQGSIQGRNADEGGGITRRDFIHRSLVTGAALGAASQALFPFINVMDVAYGAEAFRFAWISDTHLYPKTLNTRFVEKAERAVADVNAMKPAPDFLIFGGDLAQLGDPVELQLGADILKGLKVKKKHFIPGEHDWYLDMGATWEKLFGKQPWSFDHKGVRFIGLDTVSRAPDYWSAKKMTPEERMGHMATLDGSVAGPWAGVGDDQLQWMSKTLSGWSKDKPVVVFTHNPLYEYYPPWNFWVRDWRAVQEVLRPYQNVTNIHGHTHQVLYNEIGTMRSIGMLATSWPWPYAPEGVPALTKPMLRADPGDHFDGVGWGKLAMTGAMRVNYQYMMWRKAADVFAETHVDSARADNINEILSPRIADRP
ncbi:MAG: metallophosphoesterase [Syntrophaceae bacterium]